MLPDGDNVSVNDNIFKFDEASLDHNKTERWKLFQESELSKLFQIIQYRTYCYCEREKRTSLKLKQMINNDTMYLMKMEELHSKAINEELNALKLIFHIETLSNFLKSLVLTENKLDKLFIKHQQCHDIIYKSIELHLNNTGILYKTQPIFNWYISDYQQMWIYQELFYSNFEKFLLSIAIEYNNNNIYCCHKDDFDAENKYRYKINPSISMISKFKRTKENIHKYYVNKFGESFNPKDTFFCFPKNPSRSFFKVFYDYDGNVSRLTDFLRASFVFDNFEDLYNALFVINDYVKKHNKNPMMNNKYGQDIGILKFKNSFTKHGKLNNGGRQIMINVPLCADEQTSVPIICEIQLHFCVFWQFKEQTHRLYQISRLFNIRDHQTENIRI